MSSEVMRLAEDESRKAKTYFVGTEHLFLAIANQRSPDVGDILSRKGVMLANAVAEVRKLIRQWRPDENWSGLLSLTPRVKDIDRKATILASKDGSGEPVAKHYLLVMLQNRICHTVRAILGPPVDESNVETMDSGSMSIELEAPGQSSRGRGRSALEFFGRNLTELAREGKLNKLSGRQQELELMLRTLTRQVKPNPLIVGEAGTGKTALVEGLAQAIVDGNVPPLLKDTVLIEISVSSLVAGTKYRGEFEERLEELLAESAKRPEVIIFLDEFHLAVGAGAAGSGGMDAANVLKPALARGELRCVAATTLNEYRKWIEPDDALTRRFHKITLNEPGDQETKEILRSMSERLEEHHQVRIQAAAIDAAVELSGRYLTDKNQPDRSIDVLDDACTRVDRNGTDSPEVTTSEVNLPEVTVQQIALSISDRTGIPVSSISVSDREKLSSLEGVLSRTIKGQEEAIKVLSDALREVKLGLREENRPMGTFLFTGPSGVGKTALAECLAHEFFGLKEQLVRIDMTEYTEPHSVSRLIGAPPGYVGHDEQGQLTRALRARPHSLVLLDEVEKGHPQIMDVFLQTFGSGRLTDGRGDFVDCRHAMFVMTSNLGFESGGNDYKLGLPSAVSETDKRSEQVEDAMEACRAFFRPEFLNRIDKIVVFQSLSMGALHEILLDHLEEITSGLQRRAVSLKVSEEVREWLIKKSGSNGGVPALKRLVREQILNKVTECMVSHPAANELAIDVVCRDNKILVNVA